MDIKLLAFDLDGTSIIDHKYLPSENREALIKAREKGVILVPSTGRIVSYIPKDVLEIDGIKYAITANGGSVYKLENKEILHEALLKRETALAIEEILCEYPLYLEYYLNGQPTTKERNLSEAIKNYGIPERKHHFLGKNYTYIDSLKQGIDDLNCLPPKINMPFIPENLREEIILRLSQFHDITITYSDYDNLEINDKHASKGYALRFLCDYLNINSENVMAIGDNGNDISMLDFAGTSVAMGNANQSAKDAAKHITENCDDFGFAKAVEKFILV